MYFTFNCDKDMLFYKYRSTTTIIMSNPLTRAEQRNTPYIVFLSECCFKMTNISVDGARAARLCACLCVRQIDGASLCCLVGVVYHALNGKKKSPYIQTTPVLTIPRERPPYWYREAFPANACINVSWQEK